MKLQHSQISRIREIYLPFYSKNRKIRAFETKSFNRFLVFYRPEIDEIFELV